MLGFEGVGVLLAYVGSILTALLCVAYGIKNWNSEENELKEIEEELAWEKKDPDLGGSK